MFAPALYIQDIWSRENIKTLKFSAQQSRNFIGTETETTFYLEICIAKNCNPEHMSELTSRAY
jgi:hypothetical protein